MFAALIVLVAMALALYLDGRPAAGPPDAMAYPDPLGRRHLKRGGSVMRLAIALLCLGLILPAPARAADQLTLLLDWFVNPGPRPRSWWAQARGYFADAGLEVEII